jgi:hypothetical protein
LLWTATDRHTGPNRDADPEWVPDENSNVDQNADADANSTL